MIIIVKITQSPRMIKLVIVLIIGTTDVIHAPKYLQHYDILSKLYYGLMDERFFV